MKCDKRPRKGCFLVKNVAPDIHTLSVLICCNMLYFLKKGNFEVLGLEPHVEAMGGKLKIGVEFADGKHYGVSL